ncbi:response regulator [Chitinimonas naiadis]
MYHVMLVDDEPHILSALSRALSNRQPELATQAITLTLHPFNSPTEALHHAFDVPIDLIISDYRMPEMSGVEFLCQMREHQPDAARIILSGYADLQGLIQAINAAQIQRFIGKPWVDFDLREAVIQTIRLRELQQENARLADTVRVAEGRLSQQEAALRRLEQESPGITRVNWDEEGGVLLEVDD